MKVPRLSLVFYFFRARFFKTHLFKEGFLYFISLVFLLLSFRAGSITSLNHQELALRFYNDHLAQMAESLHSVIELEWAKIRMMGETHFGNSLSDSVWAVGSHTEIPNTFEADSDILDIGLWVQDQTLQYKKVHASLNAKFANVSGAPLVFAQLIQQAEGVEANLLSTAFQGRITMAPALRAFMQPLFLVAIPVGKHTEKGASAVLAVHFRLNKIVEILNQQNFIYSFVTDVRGEIVAESDAARFKDTFPGLEKQLGFVTQLRQKMLTSRERNESLVDFSDKKTAVFGGYSRILLGSLVVFGISFEADAGAQVTSFERSIIAWWVMGALSILAGLGGLFLRLSSIRALRTVGQISESKIGAKRTQVIVIYMTFRQVDQFIDLSAPPAAAQEVNEYFTMLQSIVKKYDGLFLPYSERSLLAVWGALNSDGTEIWRALRSALEIREELYKLIEDKKSRGLKSMPVTMGVQSGSVLLAPLQGVPVPYTFLGEAINGARALSALAFSAGVDLLISQEVWQKSEARFEGEPLKDVQLKSEGEWVDVFSLSGYRDEQGQVNTVKPHPDAVLPSQGPPTEEAGMLQGSGVSKKSHRWLVNNGSQIIGPLTLEEIAVRLFAQELDFDCECWTEEGGTPGKIQNSGMFSGSDAVGASLWLFDGTTIHGPMLAGFVKTALGHGAIQSQVYVCETSTVNGWKPIEQWDFTVSTLPQPLTLRHSIAPPGSSNQKTKNSSEGGLDSFPKKKVV